MLMKRVSNVIKKEWEVMFTSINNTLFITILPLLIVAQFTAVIYFAGKIIGDNTLNGIMANSMIQKSITNMETMLSIGTGSITPVEKFQLLLLSQIPFYLLLIPTMIAISFASFSIMEEKQTKTLEPLLATPVRTSELLLGKAFSGAIPAIIVTWFYAGVSIIGARLILSGGIVSAYILKGTLAYIWLITLLLMVPVISVLSFLLGVISSSRVSDAKNAQNGAIFIVLPVFALIGVQISGFVMFTPILLVLLGIVIGVVDIFVLRLAVKLFQRESIITRWK
jgi:ABC-2 type transport system permease protein